MSNLIGSRTPREFVTGMINDLFVAPREPAADAFYRYAHRDSRHHSDGKAVDGAAQIAHLDYLHANAVSMRFDVEQVVFDGEWLAVRHIGHVAFSADKRVDSEVQSFFHIVDGKISEAFEMTRPLSGDEADRAVHTVR